MSFFDASPLIESSSLLSVVVVLEAGADAVVAAPAPFHLLLFLNPNFLLGINAFRAPLKASFKESIFSCDFLKS